MKGQAPISSIYRHAPAQPADPDWESWSRIERLRRKAWLDAGVVAVLIPELPEHLRSAVKAWAEETYGPR